MLRLYGVPLRVSVDIFWSMVCTGRQRSSTFWVAQECIRAQGTAAVRRMEAGGYTAGALDV
jgi:hypothetical protein